MHDSVSLRPARAEDQEFLYRVYYSTREAELAPTGWRPEQKEAFVRQQFTAQSHHYVAHYPGALFQIIEVAAQPVGRLYIHDRPSEIRIMDIALLPEFRARGIGAFLMEKMQGQGRAQQKTVTIHVEVFNPAMRLYERMGFKKMGGNDVHQLMEWKP